MRGNGYQLGVIHSLVSNIFLDLPLFPLKRPCTKNEGSLRHRSDGVCNCLNAIASQMKHTQLVHAEYGWRHCLEAIPGEVERVHVSQIGHRFR